MADRAKPTQADLTTAIQALLDAIMHDEAKSGGLLTRATIRKADELRIMLARNSKPKASHDA